MKTAAFALVATLAIVSHPRAQDDRFKVFVTSSGAVNGFTDPDKQSRDTVKDLREDLADRKKLITVLDSPEGADVVLTVLGRQTEQVTFGFLGGAARDRVIHVKFQAASVDTELTASAQGGTLGSGGAWGKAAGKIAKQVEQWLKENGAKLRASAGGDDK